MFDYVQFQDDLTMALLCASSLQGVPVKSYYRMVLNKEVDFRTIVTQGRGSGTPCGSGIIVAEPTARSIAPVTGVMFEWTFPIVCLYMPVIADDPANGTLLNDSALVQRVADTLQLYADDGAGTVKINTAEPEREFAFEGCRGTRVNVGIIAKSTQTVRCARAAISFAGQCTLTCPQAGAEVCYTLDGTFPARASLGINPNSIPYVAPFDVSVGLVVRAAAYLDGLINSQLTYAVAP